MLVSPFLSFFEMGHVMSLLYSKGDIKERKGVPALWTFMQGGLKEKMPCNFGRSIGECAILG